MTQDPQLQKWNVEINNYRSERVESMIHKLGGLRSGIRMGSIDRSMISDLIRWEVEMAEKKREFQGRHGLKITTRVETLMKNWRFSEREVNEAYGPIEAQFAAESCGAASSSARAY